MSINIAIVFAQLFSKNRKIPRPTIKSQTVGYSFK
nr:MAG TPA: hypothetical protein [Caudoviricetes sp.]